MRKFILNTVYRVKSSPHSKFLYRYDSIDFDNVIKKDDIVKVIAFDEEEEQVLLHFENRPYKGHDGHIMHYKECEDLRCWWFSSSRLSLELIKIKKVNIEEV